MFEAPWGTVDACHSRDIWTAQFEQQWIYFELGEIRQQVDGTRGCGFEYSVSNESTQFGQSQYTVFIVRPPTQESWSNI